MRAFMLTSASPSQSQELLTTMGTSDLELSSLKKLCQLSTCQYERQDHLRESFSAPVLVLACIPASQAGQKQPTLSFPDPVLFAHLVEKSEIFASDSEQLEKQEIYPYILGVQAWRKREQREPQCLLPKQFPQTGQ